MVNKEYKEQLVDEKADKARDIKPAPQLPADFYKRLLKMPSCKTTGVCDNCGRCKR